MSSQTSILEEFFLLKSVLSHKHTLTTNDNDNNNNNSNIVTSEYELWLKCNIKYIHITTTIVSV